jgi:hypothetical protein
MRSKPELVSADVRPRGPRVAPDEPVPQPYKGNRSVVSTVIDPTGPIGRRLVIVAGVLVAALIGIGAFRLEERTHIIKRIQDWRHFEDY